MTDAAEYIEPLHMNGMDGRMLRAPATGKLQREILLVYGHHAMLERWWGLVQNLQRYGSVTMPDLPGFGGMDSFYKIGRTLSIDAYADYLAAFVTMRYRRRRVTIMGISFGFVVVTRMLQRYSDLAKKVDLVVSLVGFVHHDDFLYSPKRRRLYSRACYVLGTKPLAFVTHHGILNETFIRGFYRSLPAGRTRLLAMDSFEFKQYMDFEVELWRANDMRTHWRTTSAFLMLDNCTVPVRLPVWHIASASDHYFDNTIVEQHMRVVFEEYNQAIMNSNTHTPSILATKKEMAVMLPSAFRKALSKK
jgi:pimeloyl-ACP methyl ester carboxylesterase